MLNVNPYHFRCFLIRMVNAQIRADQPIDDSAVVDDMFGFLEDQKDTISESQAPSAFRDLPAPKVLSLWINKSRICYFEYLDHY
jgi:hypothetical protein